MAGSAAGASSGDVSVASGGAVSGASGAINIASGASATRLALSVSRLEQAPASLALLWTWSLAGVWVWRHRNCCCWRRCIWWGSSCAELALKALVAWLTSPLVLGLVLPALSASVPPLVSVVAPSTCLLELVKWAASCRCPRAGDVGGRVKVASAGSSTSGALSMTSGKADQSGGVAFGSGDAADAVGSVSVSTGASGDGEAGSIDLAVGSAAESMGGAIRATAGAGLTGGQLNLKAGSGSEGLGGDVVLAAGESQEVAGGAVMSWRRRWLGQPGGGSCSRRPQCWLRGCERKALWTAWADLCALWAVPALLASVAPLWLALPTAGRAVPSRCSPVMPALRRVALFASAAVLGPPKLGRCRSQWAPAKDKLVAQRWS